MPASSPEEITRLTPSGGPDATFNGSGFSRVSGYVPNWTLASGVVIDAHGNIVLAGKAATAGVGGGNSFYVIRFTPSGTLDPTFGKGGVAQVPVNHRPRVHGNTKYGTWGRMVKGLADVYAVRWMKKNRINFQSELVDPAVPCPADRQSSDRLEKPSLTELLRH